MPPAPLPRAVSGRPWNRTLRYAHGYLRLRCCLEGTGRPLLLVHGAGGACETLESLTAAFAGRRPVITLDLPGHGESHPLPPDTRFLDCCRAALAAVLDEFGCAEADAWGEWGGATVLLDFAHAQPGRINRLALSGVQYVAAAEASDLAQNFAPRIEPVWHGGHLLEYWHVVRNQALFWPWYRQEESAACAGEPEIEPGVLHTRTLALMKSAPALSRVAGELFAYPLDGALAELSRPVLLCAAPSDPNDQHTRAAAAAHPLHDLLEFPADRSAWAELLLKYFDQ